MGADGEMRMSIESISRGVFWFLSSLGFIFLLLWMGGLLGSYRMLVVFLVPLWCAGAWGIIREIRKARGQGLPYQGIYRDRPVD